MKENLKLWNKVCETDPSHTKKVTYGRSYTAIDPMYQIRNATEQFGEVGIGWGWDILDVKYPPSNTVVVVISLWHKDKRNSYPEFGEAPLFYKDKSDNDAHKKALTDAITKGLSRLGFNADVFLGKFDDNKYVKQMEEKHKNKGIYIEYSANDMPPSKWINNMLERAQGYVNGEKPTSKGLAGMKQRLEADLIYGKLNVSDISLYSRTWEKLEEILKEKGV